MRVQLKSEAQRQELSDEAQRFVTRYFPNGDVAANLTMDTDYVVVAVRGTEFGPLLYIEDDTENGLPVPYPMPLLTVVDSRMPESWGTDMGTLGPEPGDQKWLGPSFWRSRGDLFYERLVDGWEQEEDAYQAYRQGLSVNE